MASLDPCPSVNMCVLLISQHENALCLPTHSSDNKAARRDTLK